MAKIIENMIDTDVRLCNIWHACITLYSQVPDGTTVQYGLESFERLNFRDWKILFRICNFKIRSHAVYTTTWNIYLSRLRKICKNSETLKMSSFTDTQEEHEKVWFINYSWRVWLIKIYVYTSSVIFML